jgi:dUTPase
MIRRSVRLVTGEYPVNFTLNNTNKPKEPTKNKIGYDLYAPIEIIINANSSEFININLIISVPFKTYGTIIPGIDQYGRVSGATRIINYDDTENISILLTNNTNNNIVIKKDDKIAQLILTEYMKTVKRVFS